MAIADRYRALGFTEEDAVVLRAWRDLAKRIGMTPVDRERLIEEFSRVNRKMTSWPIEQKGEWFLSVAHTLRLTDDQCGHVFAWHLQAMERGIASTLSPAPTAHELQQERDEIERIMKEDPGRYWKDNNLQLRYADALDGQAALIEAAGGARVDSGTGAIPQSSARKKEIEKLMGDQRSEYWLGPNANAIQNEYRQLITAEQLALPSPTAT